MTLKNLDPYQQALGRKLSVEESGYLKKIFEIGLNEDFLSAKAYYNAGVIYQQMYKSFRLGSAERLQLENLSIKCYEISIVRFENHFQNQTGTEDDSDRHIYSMCCRNRAMIDYLQEKFIACIDLHSKGIATSPFYEHYQERSDCYHKLERWPEAGEDSAIVLNEYADHLTSSLVIVHFYRIARGRLESQNLSRAKSAAEEAMTYVDGLTPNERKSLEKQLPKLFGVIAEIFEKTGDTILAQKLNKEFGQKKAQQDDVKALLIQATEMVRAQKYAESLPLWDKVNLIQPRNIDALNWRVWILATLQNHSAEKQFTPQIVSLSQGIILLMTKPSSEWYYTAKNAMVKGFESSLGNIAWQILENSQDKNELLTAVTMIDEAVDEVLDCYRQDDIRYLIDTKVRLLLKLNHIDEAYAQVRTTLSADEQFADFQDIKLSAEYNAWCEKSTLNEAVVRDKRFYFGPKLFEVRPPYQVLMAGFVKECVLKYYNFRKSKITSPENGDFDISPENFAFGRKIVKLDKLQKKQCVQLFFMKDPSQFPELGLFDNLEGEDPVHEFAIEELCESLLGSKLDWSETELVQLLKANELTLEVLKCIGQFVGENGMSAHILKELTDFTLLADEEEKLVAQKILTSKKPLHS